MEEREWSGLEARGPRREGGKDGDAGGGAPPEPALDRDDPLWTLHELPEEVWDLGPWMGGAACRSMCGVAPHSCSRERQVPGRRRSAEQVLSSALPQGSTVRRWTSGTKAPPMSGSSGTRS